MSLNRYINSLLLAGTLTVSALTTGCAAQMVVGSDYYDPYHRDYHHWDDGEVRFYNQWSVETHRPSGRDYNRLKRGEQRQYWDWRHNHK